MKYPLFSILIANYNNGEYLKKAIESIYEQSYSNWEIVIVDDKSTDISSDIYKKLKEDSRIKIFYNKSNEGVGYTKKRCIDEAIGEICAFLDPDDALTSDALEVMVEAHDANPSHSLVHSKFYYCNEHLEVQSEYLAGKQIENRDPYFFNQEGEISHFASFKKKNYLQTSGLDLYYKRAVDQDLYYKLYEAGETLYIDQALYYYRLHSRGVSTFGNSEKAGYWKWFIILEAARRRNLDIETIFATNFVARESYDDMMKQFLNLSKEYNRLFKYKKINDIFYKINSLFRR